MKLGAHYSSQGKQYGTQGMHCSLTLLPLLHFGFAAGTLLLNVRYA